MTHLSNSIYNRHTVGFLPNASLDVGYSINLGGNYLCTALIMLYAATECLMDFQQIRIRTVSIWGNSIYQILIRIKKLKYDWIIPVADVTKSPLQLTAPFAPAHNLLVRAKHIVPSINHPLTPAQLGRLIRLNPKHKPQQHTRMRAYCVTHPQIMRNIK